jgi:hypothetical protein
MVTTGLSIPITERELERIQILESEFTDYCVDSTLLFDPSRYSPDPRKAREQFLKRYNMFDCYRGVLAVAGEPRVGKSGWVSAFAWQGREWFDLRIITMGFHYTEKFGPHTYINHEGFLTELEKTSLLASRTGDQALNWDSSDTESLFKNSIIIIEEAHKFLAHDQRTRASIYIKDLIAEWGHYDTLVVLITHNIDLLDPKRVGKFITHQATVSRNYNLSQTSDVRIFHRATGEWKPTIEFYRPNWHDLWATKAPIMIRTNISSEEIKRRQKNLKRQIETGE